MNYGGRLGEITRHYPEVQCSECNTYQVQLIDYLFCDPKYKCRECKHIFTLPFKAYDEGDEW